MRVRCIALLALLMVVALVIGLAASACWAPSAGSDYASDTRIGPDPAYASSLEVAAVPTSLPTSTIRQSGGEFPCAIDTFIGQPDPHPSHFLHWIDRGRELFVFGKTATEAVPLVDDLSGYAAVSFIELLNIETGQHWMMVDVNPDRQPGFSFYADVSPVDFSTVYTSCEYWQEENDTEIALIDSYVNRKRLTDNDTDEYFPIWSPDGERIAFVSSPVYLSSQQEDYWITILDINNASEVRIDTALLHPVSWSPDGETLAFIRASDGDSLWREVTEVDLFSVPSDGSETPRKLASAYAWQTARLPRTMSVPFGGPAWSPDGNWIAFGSSKQLNENPEGVGEVLVISSDGAVEKTAWYGRVFSPITQVSWSPDGEEILFVADDVFVVRPDGSDFRRIDPFVHPDTPQYAFDAPRIAGAAWSPDSSRIAFYDGQFTITTVNRDGADVRIYKVPCGRCLYGR